MEFGIDQTTPILLVGEGILLASVALCLVNAGHEVNVLPVNSQNFTNSYDHYEAAQKAKSIDNKLIGSLYVHDQFSLDQRIKLAIAIVPEDLTAKVNQLRKLEVLVSADTVIAINTESYALADLQSVMNDSSRLIGLNWTEPAHTTFFLEIISNGNDQTIAHQMATLAKKWTKDAYIVKNSGVRGLLISAMAREASFLVDNGYASIDDIDRACRNDAGYYLPFAGNCRYMDLMGTYAYGMVMKDLNPELSKDKQLPQFLEHIHKEGGLGMENRSGFYNYSADEVEYWQKTMEKFSYEIQGIISKYPFNYDGQSY